MCLRARGENGSLSVGKPGPGKEPFYLSFFFQE